MCRNIISQARQKIMQYSLTIWPLFIRQSNSVKFVLIVILVLFLWMFSGVLFPSNHHDDVVSESNLAYKLLPSEATSHAKVVKLIGTTRAKQKVEIITEASGLVAEILVTKGQFVKRGAVIAKIESKNKVEILESARSKLRQSEIDFNAALKLSKKGFSSDADLARAKAHLYSAIAALRKAEIDLNNTEVKAPFDGYINDISVSVGEYIGGADTPRGNSGLGTLVSAEPMIIDVFVGERDIKLLKKGLSAYARLMNNNGNLSGIVTSVSKVLDHNTNTFPVEITLNNHDFSILSGQNAEVTLLFGEQLAHKVPHSVLDLDADGNVGIKIVDDAGVVRFKSIDIIDEEFDGIWIAGLGKKENIIVVGQSYIQPGTQLVLN